MAKIIPVYKSTVGINNKLDPARLKFDPERGITQLSEGVNIDIDSTGRISRRKGFERKREEAGNSLWADGEDCFYVSGNALFRLQADFTRTGLRSGLSDKPFSFVKVNGEVFYSNGNESGVIKGNVSYGWSSLVKPTGHITTRILSPPPKGEILSYYSGRILIVSEDILWYTEVFAYYWCDLGQNFISLKEKITLLAPVLGGVFIGTEKAVYFLRGKDIKEGELEKIADYGAVKGTLALVKQGVLPDELRVKGSSYIFFSKEGLCFITANGEFSNLTYKMVKLPVGQDGAGLCIGDRYIGLLNP